eukprot:GEMP01061134.1.p1 GENE.GEMP01061134.1~~GEMP01061134.1.p1  ORF type:complete len:312 (+),score=45.49 GEMP01061134.1:29-937(+)
MGEAPRLGCTLESTCVRIPKDEEKWTDLTALYAAESGSVILSFGRHLDNSFSVEDKRVSSMHFNITVHHQPDRNWDFYLHDTSLNGTWVNFNHVHGSSMLLRDGDVVVILPSSRVGEADFISFLFHVNSPVPDGEVAEEFPVPCEALQVSLASQLSEEMSCGICSEVFFNPLCIVPCLHNFCSVCFLQWAMSRSCAVVCPICRCEVEGARPNHHLRSILATFLKNRPDKGRSPRVLRALQEKEERFFLSKDIRLMLLGLARYECNASDHLGWIESGRMVDADGIPSPNRRRNSRRSAACTIS